MRPSCRRECGSRSTQSRARDNPGAVRAWWSDWSSKPAGARLSLGRFDSYTLPPRAVAVRPALPGGVPPATLVRTPRHGGVGMNRKGVTLIELLIGLRCVGLLATIAMP